MGRWSREGDHGLSLHPPSSTLTYVIIWDHRGVSPAFRGPVESRGRAKTLRGGVLTAIRPPRLERRGAIPSHLHATNPKPPHPSPDTRRRPPAELERHRHLPDPSRTLLSGDSRHRVTRDASPPPRERMLCARDGHGGIIAPCPHPGATPGPSCCRHGRERCRTSRFRRMRSSAPARASIATIMPRRGCWCIVRGKA